MKSLTLKCVGFFHAPYSQATHKLRAPLSLWGSLFVVLPACGSIELHPSGILNATYRFN